MRNFVKMERFVVEIVVLPWLALSSDLRNHIGVQTGFSGIALHPFYEDEEGKCYYRRQGTTQKLTDEDVIQLTRLQTKSAIRRYLIDNPKYYAWFRRKWQRILPWKYFVMLTFWCFYALHFCFIYLFTIYSPSSLCSFLRSEVILWSIWDIRLLCVGQVFKSYSQSKSVWLVKEYI